MPIHEHLDRAEDLRDARGFIDTQIRPMSVALLKIAQRIPRGLLPLFRIVERQERSRMGVENLRQEVRFPHLTRTHEGNGSPRLQVREEHGLKAPVHALIIQSMI